MVRLEHVGSVVLGPRFRALINDSRVPEEGRAWLRRIEELADRDPTAARLFWLEFLRMIDWVPADQEPVL